MFDGVPVWHVSVARITSNRLATKPVDLWVTREIKDAAVIALKSIDGVGNKMRQWEERGEMAIHIRRHLSQPEIDLLWKVRPQCPVFTDGIAQPTNG